jgi:hypothetical protein
VAPILWGEPGTNGQHAFYQLIHQGGRLIPCEFIACRKPDFDLPGHHAKLLANCFAQGEALMRGKTLDEPPMNCGRRHGRRRGARLAPFRSFPGNQPSTTLLLPRLDPYNLGAADRALRTQGLRRERDLGHQPLRPVGRRIRQAARQPPAADHRRQGAGHRARQFDGWTGCRLQAMNQFSADDTDFHRLKLGNSSGRRQSPTNPMDDGQGTSSVLIHLRKSA